MAGSLTGNADHYIGFSLDFDFSPKRRMNNFFTFVAIYKKVPQTKVRHTTRGNGTNMLAGHLGAALIFKRADMRLNLGVLFFAALLLDFILWSLVLSGAEHVHIPADYARRHYLTFEFPYSHSLIMSLVWAALLGVVAWGLWSVRSTRFKIGIVIALTVFSHFVLDALVHVPELPILGGTSMKIGLGLEDTPQIALLLELGISLFGLLLYLWPGPLRRRSTTGLTLLVLAVTVLTAVGMMLAPAPATEAQSAVGALVTITFITVMGTWLDRSATRRPKA
jgi:hypothetical protein